MAVEDRLTGFLREGEECLISIDSCWGNVYVTK